MPEGPSSTSAARCPNHIAALDATIGNAANWSFYADNSVIALAVRDTTVYAGATLPFSAASLTAELRH